LDALPFNAKRSAPLADVAALLRGEVEIAQVHRLVPLFALLDWRDAGEAPEPVAPHWHPVAPPAYLALRLWLELGIHPPEDSRPPRDGAVARALALGAKSQVEQATERALARLRAAGLPWNDNPHPTGKAVGRFMPVLSEAEARRMAVAVLTPISKRDTLSLSRRLWVGTDDGLERKE
jgi:CRISPR-associated protein Csx17